MEPGQRRQATVDARVSAIESASVASSTAAAPTSPKGGITARLISPLATRIVPETPERNCSLPWVTRALPNTACTQAIATLHMIRVSTGPPPGVLVTAERDHHLAAEDREAERIGGTRSSSR